MSEPTLNEQEEAIQVDYEKGNFSFPENYEYDAGTGLTEATIEYISKVKKEADWVKEFRLKALEIFNKKPMPTHWASADLENIVFDNIRYYLSKGQRPSRTWEEVPDDVKETFERLGIPEQEKEIFSWS